VSKAGREVLADWLIVFGAVWLFVSLFLTWSHQFSPAFLSSPSGSSPLLQGAPHDPNAWQVYSDMDVVLALLALAFAAVALIGGRSARIIVWIAAVIAFAFTVHAISDPPTNTKPASQIRLTSGLTRISKMTEPFAFCCSRIT